MQFNTRNVLRFIWYGIVGMFAILCIIGLLAVMDAPWPQLH